MNSTVLELDTANRAVVDLTDEAARFCQRRGAGLLHVFAPHATAGLALTETGSGSEADLIDALDRLLLRDHPYRHGADHLLPALVSPSLAVPVEAGRLLLGVWQRIVLVDLNPDNRRRQVRFSFVMSG
jgi:secondary thiamine-phosphate synthase enzyme